MWWVLTRFHDIKMGKRNDLRHFKKIMFMPIGIPFLENSHGILCFVSIP
jgi:hypothetical protein